MYTAMNKLIDDAMKNATPYMNAHDAYVDFLGEPSNIKSNVLEYAHELMFTQYGKEYKINTVILSRTLSQKMTAKQVLKEMRKPSTQLYVTVNKYNWLVVTDKKPFEWCIGV